MSHFGNGKILLIRVNCNGSNSSPVFGVESLLVFGEVVVDGIGDASGIEDAVSVQDESVVALEAVVAVEAVQLDHCLGNGAVWVNGFLVAVVVVEIISNLCSAKRYFGYLVLFFLLVLFGVGFGQY